MDEPLSNLDARLRLDMRSELKRLHFRLGVTTVYVTHDQIEAMTMASRVVVMNAGEIQQIDAPRTIYHKPASLFVAEFVGMPRINSLPAQVVKQDGKTWLRTDVLTLEIPAGLSEQELTAAISPEDITLYLESQPDMTEFKVYAVLPSGPEQYVQVKKNDRILMIRETRPLDLKMDQSVWIQIEPSAINLYHKENGAAISMHSTDNHDGEDVPYS
jgi:ABC-type sugar transport system ATPase subunit